MMVAQHQHSKLAGKVAFENRTVGLQVIVVAVAVVQATVVQYREAVELVPFVVPSTDVDAVEIAVVVDVVVAEALLMPAV